MLGTTEMTGRQKMAIDVLVTLIVTNHFLTGFKLCSTR